MVASAVAVADLAAAARPAAGNKQGWQMNTQNRWVRLWRHGMYPRLRVAKYFPPHELQQLSRQITQSETQHTGQIRFVIESSMDFSAVWHGLSPRNRALQWFGELGVWDTEHNSGVLVYVSFADHAVEIIADRGINAKVAQDEWQTVCNEILDAFRQQQFIDGLQQGLQHINTILSTCFPRSEPGINELPDDVVLR